MRENGLATLLSKLVCQQLSYFIACKFYNYLIENNNLHVTIFISSAIGLSSDRVLL
eukprot:XP_001704544.1 Hypothetical protein GL50803_97437 [Giardia lamblia ATCC 50803]